MRKRRRKNGNNKKKVFLMEVCEGRKSTSFSSKVLFT